LGDSFVWGFGVDFDQTVGERLRALQPNLEVVNLGVSGYSTDQELLLYQQEGVKYHADLVVVVVSSNDFHGNQRTEEYLIYGKPAFIPQGDGLHLVNQPVRQVSWIRRLAVKMAWESYILTRLQRYLYEMGVNRAIQQASNQSTSTDVVAVATRPRPPFPRTAAWNLLVKLLMAFNDATSREGAKLLVVFVEDIDARDASQYLKQLGIESLPLQDSISPIDPATHLPGDFHWNAAGHQQVAEVLSTKVRELLELPPKTAHKQSLSLPVRSF
jgi:lysophospholipase L1-like esterase